MDSYHPFQLVIKNAKSFHILLNLGGNLNVFQGFDGFTFNLAATPFSLLEALPNDTRFPLWHLEVIFPMENVFHSQPDALALITYTSHDLRNWIDY